MSKRTDDLSVQVESLRAELLELREVEDPTDEQVTRSEEALAEYETADAELVKARVHDEKIEAIRTAAANPAQVERTFEAPNVVVRKDPYGDLEGVRAGFGANDYKSRALNALEDDKDSLVDDSQREAATKLIQRGGSDVARHALLTNSPAYRSAFQKYLESPDHYQVTLSDGEREAIRTALSTTAGNGGHAIPFLLDPQVVVTSDGAAGGFRDFSRVETGTSNKWQGVTSAGATAEWKTEGSQAGDGTPTTAQPAITAYLADVFVLASYEITGDAASLIAQLPGVLAEEKFEHEEAAFAVGSGSGAPFGVVTAVAAVTASRVSPTTAGTFTSASTADVYKTVAALPPRHRGSSRHIANYATFNIVRQMSGSAAGSHFWANLGAGVPEQLLGLPIHEASGMDSSMTTGSDILLTGNFSRYVIYDRLGATLEYIPNIFGADGRPTGQRGWMYWWRVGADSIDDNAFRVLRL